MSSRSTLSSASTSPGTVGIANVANALTVVRLILVPVFAVCFAYGSDARHPAWRYAATAVFVLASLTDRVDGELARRRSLVTTFGKIADPLADKALVGAALIALSAVGDLPWWVTAVILAREFGVTALRFWVIRAGIGEASRGGVLAASQAGKIKTVTQAVAIGLYLLPVAGVWGTARAWVMGIAVAITLATGVNYVYRAIKVRIRQRQAHRSVRSSQGAE
ncbi:MAG: CDP-diacylglycerol--glycerol-3-phosphate 3-phosphatidyltransferase [Acidothermus sp.]|nr:CDP-diacylglycerol--glycerol-3-phosphate 3-phosphatidyltransferase [Acidothermus sp.]